MWRRDLQAFLGLIALASHGSDLTLVDDRGDEKHAPRRILAGGVASAAPPAGTPSSLPGADALPGGNVTGPVPRPPSRHSGTLSGCTVGVQ